jgi:hypothetical protein
VNEDSSRSTPQAEILRLLRVIEKDMYRGNEDQGGKPSITARVLELERADERHRQDMQGMRAELSVYKDKADGFDDFLLEMRTHNKIVKELGDSKNKGWTLFWSAMAALAAVVATIIAIATWEQATKKSLVNQKSEVLNAEQIKVVPWVIP